jgi:hypothetical protein
MFLLQNPSPRSPSRLRLAKSPALARLAWTIMVAAVVNPSAAEEPKPLEKARAAESAFLRLSKDADGDLESLDTSIVRYAPPKDRGGSTGIKVDLVAAVHIGSRSYYENLETRFKGYDCVLYELVAPEKSRVPKPGRKPSGMIGQAQSGLTSLLGLEFQLERIDYAAKNFVHADLSPGEFDEAMERRGESWWTMFGKLMRESMNQKNAASQEVSVGDLFGAIFGNDRELRLRRIMAVQFTDMEVLTAAFSDDDGSTIITDRNAAAIDVMRREITKGKRKIAIFYGAAHMPDFDTRLRKDFGLEPVRTEWLEAWDLRDAKAR